MLCQISIAYYVSLSLWIYYLLLHCVCFIFSAYGEISMSRCYILYTNIWTEENLTCTLDIQAHTHTQRQTKTFDTVQIILHNHSCIMIQWNSFRKISSQLKVSTRNYIYLTSSGVPILFHCNWFTVESIIVVLFSIMSNNLVPFLSKTSNLLYILCISFMKWVTLNQHIVIPDIFRQRKRSFHISQKR